jgi:hypothetical protein
MAPLSGLGGGSEQTLLMHVVPFGALQQSAVVVHLLPSGEQPDARPHTSPPSGASPASDVASQYPLQQSVPVWQPWPFGKQGLSAQKARALSATGS